VINASTNPQATMQDYLLRALRNVHNKNASAPEHDICKPRPVDHLSAPAPCGYRHNRVGQRQFLGSTTASALIRCRKPRTFARLPQVSMEHQRLGLERLVSRK